MYYTGIDPYKNYLLHHGVKGQKWGIRRFQNPDGTLTDAGRKRYLKKYGWAYERADELPQHRWEAKLHKELRAEADKVLDQDIKNMFNNLTSNRNYKGNTDRDVQKYHGYLKKEYANLQKETKDILQRGQERIKDLRAGVNSIYDKNSPEYRAAINGAQYAMHAAAVKLTQLRNYIVELESNYSYTIPEKDMIPLH